MVSEVGTSSSTAQPSRKPPGMEGKCMRCRKPEHQQGEKCAAKNAKCKECHKIGHFYKVCQSSKRTRRVSKTEVQKSRTLFLIHTLSFSIHFSRKLWGTKTKPRMRMPQLPLMPEIETKSLEMLH